MIETKLDLKQLVWYLHDGKIWHGIVQRIDVSKSDCYQHETYQVELGDCGALITKDKDELFETKELFIESIS